MICFYKEPLPRAGTGERKLFICPNSSSIKLKRLLHGANTKRDVGKIKRH